MSGRGARLRRKERKLAWRHAKRARHLSRTAWTYLFDGRYWDLFRHIVFRRLCRISYFFFDRNIFQRWTDSKHE